jgi:ADP-heptose:LPS heptosyltransferase
VRAISSTPLDLVGVVEFPPHLAQRLREFDEVISWYGTNRPEFRAAMTAVQPHCTFLKALPEKEHAVDFFLRQVGGPLGLTPQIDVSAPEQRNTVIIDPFSGSASKNWPLENYRELAARLPVPVEWIDTHFDSLLNLAAWARGAAVYIGNDSGISHLAAAIGLPGVVLFGPSNPLIWRPRGANIRILQYEPLSELPVGKVLQAVKYCLDGMPKHPGSVSL